MDAIPTFCARLPTSARADGAVHRRVDRACRDFSAGVRAHNFYDRALPRSSGRSRSAADLRMEHARNHVDADPVRHPRGVLGFHDVSPTAQPTRRFPTAANPTSRSSAINGGGRSTIVASGVVAANEIHIPVGKPILIDLQSADVIHDFWAPELGRKIDAVPGHPNTLWIEADQPGTYMGECAEFCGVEHTWMRFRVIAQSQADFDAWQRAQLAVPSMPSAPDALAGAHLFADKTCVNCHTIAGTAGQSDRRPRPDPSRRAARCWRARLRANTPERTLSMAQRAQRRSNPKATCRTSNLTDDEAHQLVAYLEGLK